MTSRMHLPLILTVATLYLGMLESNAQDFFGIPLYENPKLPTNPNNPEDQENKAPEEETPEIEELPVELSTLWEDYSLRRAEGLNKVNDIYLTKLQAIQKKYTQAGKLEEAIATRSEVQRVEKENLALEAKSGLPPLDSRTEDSSPLPAGATEAYQEQLALKFRGVTMLNHRYRKSAEDLMVEYTKKGQIQEALAAKTVAELLQRETQAFLDGTTPPTAPGQVEATPLSTRDLLITSRCFVNTNGNRDDAYEVKFGENGIASRPDTNRARYWKWRIKENQLWCYWFTSGWVRFDIPENPATDTWTGQNRGGGMYEMTIRREE